MKDYVAIFILAFRGNEQKMRIVIKIHYGINCNIRFAIIPGKLHLRNLFETSFRDECWMLPRTTIEYPNGSLFKCTESRIIIHAAVAFSRLHRSRIHSRIMHQRNAVRLCMGLCAQFIHTFWIEKQSKWECVSKFKLQSQLAEQRF